MRLQWKNEKNTVHHNNETFNVTNLNKFMFDLLIELWVLLFTCFVSIGSNHLFCQLIFLLVFFVEFFWQICLFRYFPWLIDWLIEFIGFSIFLLFFAMQKNQQMLQGRLVAHRDPLQRRRGPIRRLLPHRPSLEPNGQGSEGNRHCRHSGTPPWSASGHGAHQGAVWVRADRGGPGNSSHPQVHATKIIKNPPPPIQKPSRNDDETA